MNYKETFRNSPNASRTLNPEGIVLHHSAGSWAGLVPWIMNPSSKVSYHCVVNTNGERVILVPDNVQAWHAGVSSFKGRNSCNSFMLGIAVSGNTNTRELTRDEINSVAEWCIRKMKAYNFGIDMITTHAVIAPRRKTDVSQRAYEQIIQRIQELTDTRPTRQQQRQTHTVVSGDTLSRIAIQKSTTVAELRRLNNLSSDLIRVGQVLVVK